MPDELDASYRAMDGMAECPNGCGMSPYNPSKSGGVQCANCGADLRHF